MGCFPAQFARSLRDRLSLERAIETGTYKGDGLRKLAAIFAEATSIEISPELAEAARRSLADLPNVQIIQGNSRDELHGLVDQARPTLYWLDGHWSGMSTGGREEECPLLGELAAIGPGHADDCILIDDARLFMAPPPPPHDPNLWPTFMQLYDTLRAARPSHHITVLHDIVIVVPAAARPDADAFSRRRVGTGRVALGRRALRRTTRRAFALRRRTHVR